MNARELKELACDDCGYDLTGLADQGNCPECGAYFNLRAGTGLRSGQAARMQRTDRLLARARTIGLLLAAAATIGCGGLAILIAQNPNQPLTIAGIVAGMLLLAAVTSFLYEKPD